MNRKKIERGSPAAQKQLPDLLKNDLSNDPNPTIAPAGANNFTDQQRSDVVLKCLEELDAERTKEWEELLAAGQHLAPVAKAEAWLRYVLTKCGDYASAEALAYFQSRGVNCVREIRNLTQRWTRDFERVLCDSHQARIGRLPRHVGNFWSGIGEGYSQGATMFRVAESCDCRFLHPWLERLARQEHDEVALTPLPPVLLVWKLFAFMRSDLALVMMQRALGRGLDVIAHRQVGSTAQWIFPRARSGSSRSPLEDTENLGYASALIFSMRRARHFYTADPDLLESAVRCLLKAQLADGSWPLWAGEEGSVEVTAMSVHALGMQRSRASRRALAAAAAWLLSKQDAAGFFADDSCQDAVYSTVLSLDALAIVEGGAKLTFGCLPRKPQRSSSDPLLESTGRRSRRR